MKIKLLCAAVTAALSVAVCGCGTDADAILNAADASGEETEDEAASEDVTGGILLSEDDASDETLIYVYICGEVNSPGVYELSAGSRVYQLVDAAGGMTADADEDAVNLAEVLSDAQMVDIPSVDESSSGAEATSSDEDDGMVNINTASAAELETLNGIGEAKAASIIAYREENGAFSSTDEIMNVSGIGEGIYEKIKDYITV